MMRPTLFVLEGPTGVGKTALSLALADRWQCPIINADSRQIYSALPIGTAAPTAVEQARVKHYFVGTHALDDCYSAGQYERDAVVLLTELAQTHTSSSPFAILTGGSMLYVDAVCNGLDNIPKADDSLRHQIRKEYEQNGVEWLQQQVSTLDPVYWQTVDRSNPQRLMHCLEVCMASGKAYSSFRLHQEVTRPWRVVRVALCREREDLYQRINGRVDQMLEQGLWQEAEAAYQPYRGNPHLPNSLNTVGYREVIRCLNGEIDHEEAIRLIKQNTRHYAKRQLTWLRAKKDIHWLNAASDINHLTKEIEALIEQ